MKISKVGMIANDSPRAIDLALESVMFLKDKIGEILVEEHLLLNMAEKNDNVCSSCRSFDPGRDKIDIALVFGGDGTILRAAQSLHGSETPICGVNMGRLGFLSQVEPKDLLTSLKKLVESDYRISRRMKIDAYLGGEKLGSALNELLILGDRIGKIFRANLQLGDPFGDLMLEGDGVIISTPTGSTGHSLSAGGSVIDYHMDAIVVAPLGALTPSRTIVMSAEKEVSVIPGDDCSLAIDGKAVREAHRGTEIRICRSDSRAAFVAFDSDPYWKKLRERIGG